MSGSWTGNTTQEKCRRVVSDSSKQNSCSGGSYRQRKATERSENAVITLPMYPKGCTVLLHCTSQPAFSWLLAFSSPSPHSVTHCSQTTSLSMLAPSPRPAHTTLPHQYTAPLLCILSYLPLYDFPFFTWKLAALRVQGNFVPLGSVNSKIFWMQRRNYMANPQPRHGDRLTSDTDTLTALGCQTGTHSC